MRLSLVPLQATVLAALLTGCFGDSDKSTDTESTDACNGTVLANGLGEPSGYVACEGGGVDKVDAAACSLEDWDYAACDGSEEVQDCSSDADCTDGPNGTCVSGVTNNKPWDTGVAKSYCGCEYPCETDDDCGTGQVCACSDLDDGLDIHTCIDADCTTGDDCEGSEQCGLSTFYTGCEWELQTSCRTDADECEADADCTTGDCAVEAYNDDGAFLCQTETCDIGRPLTTPEGARTAPTTERDDWSVGTSLEVDLEGARRWRQVAALEHASVASFARFTLQLMALGAPPELLSAVQRAAADEVRHAQLAFGIASALGDAPVGPGRLSLDGVTVATELADVARALVVEACVGETLGAAEARASAVACLPALRPALEEIARDETEHAALAWRCLAWMLTLDDSLVEQLPGWVEAALATHAPDVEDPGAPHLGILSGAERHALFQRVAAEVIRPALAVRLAA